VRTAVSPKRPAAFATRRGGGYNLLMRGEQTFLPGADLVEAGLRDLARGVESVPALAVLVGAPRLRALGIAVPPREIAQPELRLYQALAALDPDAAHGRYNAVVRRLVSFERAAACAA
jgi:hypothetical protein